MDNNKKPSKQSQVSKRLLGIFKKKDINDYEEIAKNQPPGSPGGGPINGPSK